MPKAMPVLYWHTRQWHIETRIGSPVQSTVSWPQQQVACRVVIGRLPQTLAEAYVQNRRLRVRLREKDAKRHKMPCHQPLETGLVASLDGAGRRDDPMGPLFRTIGQDIARHPSP
jgi:hypothetical protein